MASTHRLSLGLVRYAPRANLREEDVERLPGGRRRQTIGKILRKRACLFRFADRKVSARCFDPF